MTAPSPERIYLSPPHLGEEEMDLVTAAIASNWVAPAGPDLEAFEREFEAAVGARHAVAVSSGTAALHLALQLSGVGPGDVVLASTLTFAASVNPIRYVGATPHFVDSERRSWNMDPDLFREAVESLARRGRPPKAVVLVHLLGQAADIDPIQETCAEYGVTLIEDAAEALGATYRGRAPGTFGAFGIFSFNGNKIITTSGGGMLLACDADQAAHARKLATQAREPALHYEHTEVGYNYRMSNILAALGRGQLRALEDRVRARRWVFDSYHEALNEEPGLEFMPEASWGRSTRWLTCLTVDPGAFGADRTEIIEHLADENIEARPVWKPMHQQPVFEGFDFTGGEVADDLFDRGLCLPSGSAMTEDDLARVIDIVRDVGSRSVRAGGNRAVSPSTATSA